MTTNQLQDFNYLKNLVNKENEVLATAIKNYEMKLLQIQTQLNRLRYDIELNCESLNFNDGFELGMFEKELQKRLYDSMNTLKSVLRND